MRKPAIICVLKFCIFLYLVIFNYAFAAGKISACEQHSLAVDNKGAVWSWGNNRTGQLGLGGVGTMYDIHKPAEISTLNNISKVACGAYHSFAIDNNGNVWAWGNNYYGQLGDGTRIQRTSPVRISALKNIKDIAAGDVFSMALDDNGDVWLWGDNTFGQLAESDAADSLLPKKLAMLSRVIAISAGDHHALAVTNDGSVWAWGRNHRGQLGDGTTITRATPEKVPGIPKAIGVAAGELHSLVLTEDGKVFSFGGNNDGRLGNGKLKDSSLPVQVMRLKHTDSSSELDDSRGDYLLGNLGKLLLNKNKERKISSENLHPLENIKSIAAGDDHSIAIDNQNRVWLWGGNLYGQLCLGDINGRIVPTKLTSIGYAEQDLSAGDAHTLILFQNHELYGCGFNNFGQVTSDNEQQRFISKPTLISGFNYESIDTKFRAPKDADMEWANPDIRFRDGLLIYDSTPSSQYEYIIEGVTVNVDNEVRVFGASGNLYKGGITIGVVSNGKWLMQENVEYPGGFNTKLIVKKPGIYQLVIANNYKDSNDLATKLEIDKWGWFPDDDSSYNFIDAKFRAPKMKDIEWANAAISTANNQLLYNSTADSQYAYIIKGVNVDINDVPCVFGATGILYKGGVTIGVVSGEKWVAQRNVTHLGEFNAKIIIKKAGKYKLVIANNQKNKDDLDVKLKIDKWGWFPDDNPEN